MHVPHAVAGGASANAIEYRATFVRRVHQLVRLGYERLHPADHSRAEEPAITGALHAAIENVLDSPTEVWMRLDSVHDDPAEDDGQRKGKKRKRIDLRIDSAFNAPRTRFRFEAKRLGILTELQKNAYRFHALLTAIVQSDAFRMRRGRD